MSTIPRKCWDKAQLQSPLQPAGEHLGSADVSGAFSTDSAGNQPLMNLECSSTAGKEQGRIMAVVAPAQLQEQGRTLSQAGNEEKTLEKRFSLQIKNQLFHQGNEYPGNPYNKGRRPLVSPL